MGNGQKSRGGASGRPAGKSDREREELRRRRRAYYESLSPEEKQAYRERRIRRRKIRQLKKMAFSGAIMLGLIVISVVGVLLQQRGKKGAAPVSGTQASGESQGSQPVGTAPDWVVQDLIRVNEHSRPGTRLEKVNGIVVHWVANPGTTAKQNRDYFDGLADSGERDVSSHFIIDLDGTVLQCVPLGEIAYASNERNADTISIECCHPDESGKFNEATYESLVKLVKWLEETYQLQPEAVIRHYDVTGKDCPKYFVDNKDAWEQFRRDIALK